MKIKLFTVKTNLVDKWSKTGLLDSLSKPTKVKCAASLEDMGLLLVKKYAGEPTPESQMICGTILPIIVRFYMDSKNKKLPASKKLLDDYLKWLSTTGSFLDPVNNPVDEVEVCTLFAEKLVNKTKKTSKL